MTIKLKLLLYIIGTSIVATMAILIVVNHRFKTVMDENQHALYTERLDTILGILKGYDERLHMTGQVEAYSDGFKKAAVDFLKKTYYQPQDQPVFPFIINDDDDYVMLPESFDKGTLPAGATLARKMRVPGMEMAGRFEFDQRCFLYKRFDNWNWAVVYTIPMDITYAEVRKLLNILISIMVGITSLSILIMWVAIVRITRPIALLTQETRAIAQGESSSVIDVTASGEIGQLARSFIIMKDHITKLFSERDNKIAELELTRQELLARERALQQYAQRLSIHIEQTPLGVIEFDLDFRIEQWNKAAENIFGYTAREVLGRYAPDLIVHESDREPVGAVWKDLLNERGGTRSRNRNVTRDGEVISCEWYNTTLVDSDGVVMGVASLVLDVSEAKRLEEQLRQAHKMEAIGTLAGGIAHDFNNILSIILGYADMVMDDTPDHSPSKPDIEQILKAGHRAKALVKQILSFSRKEEMARAPMRIHLLVNEVLKLLRASIPTTIDIRQDIDSRSGNIMADPTQIHQVLMNLCTNAAQAMDEQGGCLEVGLKPVQLDREDLADEPQLKPGPYVKLTVRDTGAGIERKYLDRIFDPYFTTKEVGKGSGMGLAVVIGIVKSHEGMIRVDTCPGQGTAFHVYFPQIAEGAREQSDRDAALPTGHENILVVDDERSIATMTLKIVERLGYRVTLKTNSMEALELFQRQPHDFDLIITDQTMPGLTGAELASHILDIRPEIPIIISTGYSSKMDAKKADLAGISAFIMKPVDKKELAHLIRSVLDGTALGST